MLKFFMAKVVNRVQGGFQPYLSRCFSTRHLGTERAVVGKICATRVNSRKNLATISGALPGGGMAVALRLTEEFGSLHVIARLTGHNCSNAKSVLSALLQGAERMRVRGAREL